MIAPLRDLRATHFVMLGHERCGSTMLMTALAEHDRIQVYGEVFHAKAFDRKTYFPADRREYNPTADRMEIIPGGEYYVAGVNGAEFLERAIYYKRWRRDRHAIGFKLFYDQARRSAARRAWDHLAKRPEIRVLHLIRENPFHAWVSFEVARRTNQWCLLESEAEPRLHVPPFVGDFEKCRRFMRRCLEGRTEARSLFRDHPVMEVKYEADLCGSFEATMREVQRFLDVPYQKLTPQTQKQRNVPVEVQISNFDELKNHLRGTVFAEFLS